MVQLFCNETKEGYHVFVNGEEIVCTGGHPFYVVDEGFVEAKDLKIFDKLLLSSGKCVTIEEIQVEQLSEPETTYNFEVADFHTYYVGNGVCLHNRNCNDLGKAGEKQVATRSGMDKNTEVFTPEYFDISQNRIPDFMTEKKLIEIKNVARQSLTKQLRDYLEIASDLKRKPILYVRPNTVLSAPLKASGFIIRYL